MARLKMLGSRIAASDLRTARPPPKTVQPFYMSQEWRVLIDDIVKKRGRKCEKCGRTGSRVYGDHIKELQDGGEALDPANIQILCPSCHTLKSNEERARRTAAKFQ